MRWIRWFNFLFTFSPVWMDMWRISPLLLVNTELHSTHCNRCFPSCNGMCFSRTSLSGYKPRQMGHRFASSTVWASFTWSCEYKRKSIMWLTSPSAAFYLPEVLVSYRTPTRICCKWSFVFWFSLLCRVGCKLSPIRWIWMVKCPWSVRWCATFHFCWSFWSPDLRSSLADEYGWWVRWSWSDTISNRIGWGS